MMGKSDYSDYFLLCREAVSDDNLFNRFKRENRCIGTLEHVSYQLPYEDWYIDPMAINAALVKLFRRECSECILRSDF